MYIYYKKTDEKYTFIKILYIITIIKTHLDAFNIIINKLNENKINFVIIKKLFTVF
jgi:hypothetical protein